MVLLELVLAAAYCLWAIHVGQRILSYRSEWLDRPAFLNRFVKYTLCFIIGWIVAGFYLFWLIFKFVCRVNS